MGCIKMWVSQCVISLSCLPPGTGKSSIVCAMCLGLGGRPTLLGRAKEVCTAVDYVFWDIFCTPPSHFPSLFFSSIISPLSLPYPWVSLFISPPPLSLSFFFSLPFSPPLSLPFSLLFPLHTFVDQGFYQAWQDRRVYRDWVVWTTRKKPYH